MGKWTLEEEATLRKYYPILGTTVHTLFEGRTSNSCVKKARAMGLSVEEPRTGQSGIRHWTAEELQILVNNYKSMGRRVCELLPGRTEGACSQQAIKLGLTDPAPPNWTAEEIAKLVAGNAIMTRAEMAASLGKTVQAVKGQARKLCTKFKREDNWSKEEDDIIRAYFPTEGWNCSKRIPARTREAVMTRARRIGVLGPSGPKEPRRYLNGTFSVEVNGVICTSRDEVAAALNITSGALRGYLNHREKTMEDAIEHFSNRGYVYQGKRYLTLAELSKELGCPARTLCAAVSSLGFEAGVEHAKTCKRRNAAGTHANK